MKITILMDDQSSIEVCAGCLKTKVCFPQKPDNTWMCQICEQIGEWERDPKTGAWTRINLSPLI